MPFTESLAVGAALPGLDQGAFLVGGAANALSELSTALLQLSGGALAFGSPITVGTPTASGHAVTKAYADALANGLSVKAPVRVASTANLTLSGTQTIDGVACLAGNRVLAKDQSTASQNGIYVVAAGAWARAADADVSAEVVSGLYALVNEGTANADTAWVLTTNDPITLGATSLTFTQFGAPSTAGLGLTKTGNSFALGDTNLRYDSSGRMAIGGAILAAALTIYTNSDIMYWINGSKSVLMSENGFSPTNLGIPFHVNVSGTTDGFQVQEDSNASRTGTSLLWLDGNVPGRTVPLVRLRRSTTPAAGADMLTFYDSDGSTKLAKFDKDAALTVPSLTSPSVIASAIGPAGQTHTLPATASDTLALLGAAQSFTAVKTFSAAPVMASITTATGAKTLTLPVEANDTLVGKATTDTLTNKTLTSPAINTPSFGAATAFTGASATLSSLTSGRVPLASTAGLFADSAQLAYLIASGSLYLKLQGAGATGTLNVGSVPSGVALSIQGDVAQNTLTQQINATTSMINTASMVSSPYVFNTTHRADGASSASDTADIFAITHTTFSNNGSANMSASGALFSATNVNTVNSGSVTDTRPIFKGVQDTNSTGDIYQAWVGATKHFSVKSNGLVSWIAADKQTTVGAAGAASALPGAPEGYAKIDVAGVTKVVPYWAAS